VCTTWSSASLNAASGKPGGRLRTTTCADAEGCCELRALQSFSNAEVEYDTYRDRQPKNREST
jgi:hypothetical protein